MALGTIKHHGGGKGRGTRIFQVHVEVDRDIGASSIHAYQANACILSKGSRRKRGGTRCGRASGRGPTQATKKALQALARSLK